MELEFFFPGIPFAKQGDRSRIDRKIGDDMTVQNYIHHYQSPGVKANERFVKISAWNQLPKPFTPIKDPIAVTELVFIFPPLKSMSKQTIAEIESGEVVYKTTKPDLTDNLSKGLFDALQGVVYLNDSQICAMDNVKKIYGEQPGIRLKLKIMNN